MLCKRIRTANGKRPAASRKTQDEMAEKVLECIFTTSKHFNEGALIEYNAAPGSRLFSFRDHQSCATLPVSKLTITTFGRMP